MPDSVFSVQFTETAGRLHDFELNSDRDTNHSAEHSNKC